MRKKENGFLLTLVQVAHASEHTPHNNRHCAVSGSQAIKHSHCAAQQSTLK